MIIINYANRCLPSIVHNEFILIYVINYLTGDVSFFEIDEYRGPGERVLTIRYNLTTGEEGIFQYLFEGRVRERKFANSIKFYKCGRKQT